ncbi:MAG: TetR/AcrR family transcriptional regulator [Chitinophaga sp.]|uniref:TetR/AcrR family transcriptional regulator n=1 Tax=Chitinophaga sp. TaxID=1869181 RepID=UPI0025C029D2|nr:TetR/AcrR family transcriptional regulator [Chitinophaga sp.]MBV8252116.1 TetR/AcrR family transcriptional regulator [Chitinophaga sp.]
MKTKGEKTREFIIAQSAALLNKKGMAGTSISDIMEATKLAKGGIYGNFENKEEICGAVFDYLMERLNARIEGRLADKATNKEKLLAILDHYNDVTFISNAGGCPMLNFGTESDDTDPVMKEKVAGAIKASQARIARLVSAGIAAGEFVDTVHPQTFAVKMFTMFEGAVLVSKVFDNNSQMKIIIKLLKEEIESFSL